MAPKNIFPAVPVVPADPVQLAIVKVLLAVHATALLAPKVNVLTPLPRLIVVLSVSSNVPTVSVKPALAPVLKVPPPNVILDPFAIRSSADANSIFPDVTVVFPV